MFYSRKHTFGHSLKHAVTGALLAAGLWATPSFAEAPAKTVAAPTTQATQNTAQPPSLTRVSINAADAATLAEYLVGVGPSKADAIVAWRTANGRFTEAEQLLNVKGIGKATLDKNKTRITL